MKPGLGVLLNVVGFRNAYLRRSGAVWVAVRIGAAWLDVWKINAMGSLFIVLVCGSVVLMDARRRSEDLFLANLGVSSFAILMLGLPVPLAAELLGGPLTP